MRHSLTLAVFYLFGVSAFAYGREMELPITSTVTSRVTGGNKEVQCNFRSLWLRNLDEPEFTELLLPEAMYTEFLDVGIGDIELSSDGDYLFIALNGAEGIYRYSFEQKLWESVRPSDASRSVSCVTRTPRGDILIGCGGYPRNTASNLTGVFRSKDHGTTWSKVDIQLTQGGLPGIVDIAETENGLITFLGRRVTGSALGGAYTQTRSGDYVLHASALGVQVIAVGETFYIQEPKLLQYTVPTNAEVTRKVVVGDANVASVSHWAGDTVLALCTKPDSSLAYLLLIAEGTIVYKSANLGFLTDYSQPRAFASNAHNGEVLVFGSGIRHYVLRTGSSTELQVLPNRPIIRKAFSCDDFAVIRTNQHGWFQVDNSGAVTAVSQELSSQLERCSTSSEMQFKNQILALGNNVIFLINEESVDSIATAPRTQPITKLAMTNDGARLAAVINDSVFVLDRATGIWAELSATNWPTYQNGDSQKRLGIDVVFYIGDKLYAWFRGKSYPVDHHELGGLWELNSNEWQRLPSDIPYRTTEMMIGSVNGDQGVFYGVESATSGAVIAQSIARLSSNGESLIVEDNATYTVPYVRSLYASNSFVGWITAYGQMFTGTSTRIDEGDTLFSLASYSLPLEQSVLVSTNDRGVIMYRNSDLVTSINESSTDDTAVTKAIRCSDGVWCVDIEGSGSELFQVNQYDVSGRLLRSDMKRSIDGRVAFAGPTSHPSGPIFVVLAENSGSRSVTAVICP